jgi:predicted dehydrogenase
MTKTPGNQAVRAGVIGLGAIGRGHARRITETSGAVLGAVCDMNAEASEQLAEELHCEAFNDVDAMLDSGKIDAALIATPHTSHVPLGLACLQAGLHILVEKPLAVHLADARRLIDAHAATDLQAAIMFQLRTHPVNQKIKQLIDTGELGDIRRVQWTMTDWFRTQAYYESAAWRGTWAGEGGGVLLNQCPHQLDLLQWFVGLPEQVTAHCHFGKYHDIEVEDEVTAFMEYSDGITAVLMTSTGEAPGTNRLEIAADQGRLILENERLEFVRNETAASEFLRTSTETMATPPTWDVSIPREVLPDPNWRAIIQNWVNAIRTGEPLLTPLAEGLKSLELTNAMLLSAFQNRTVSLPLDADVFLAELQNRAGLPSNIGPT